MYGATVFLAARAAQLASLHGKRRRLLRQGFDDELQVGAAIPIPQLLDVRADEGLRKLGSKSAFEGLGHHVVPPRLSRPPHLG